jgi:hypothetical protein
MKVTDDEWDEYLKRYDRLMWTVARHISGDPVIADFETNYADICVAALESIKGFHKKTGMCFDEMVQSKLFDQYTKTCLWNAKNKKGSYIQKRRELTVSSISTDKEGNKLDFDEGSAVTEYNECVDQLISRSRDISPECLKMLYENPDMLGEDVDIFDYVEE